MNRNEKRGGERRKGRGEITEKVGKHGALALDLDGPTLFELIVVLHTVERCLAHLYPSHK